MEILLLNIWEKLKCNHNAQSLWINEKHFNKNDIGTLLYSKSANRGSERAMQIKSVQ